MILLRLLTTLTIIIPPCALIQGAGLRRNLLHKLSVQNPNYGDLLEMEERARTNRMHNDAVDLYRGQHPFINLQQQDQNIRKLQNITEWQSIRIGADLSSLEDVRDGTADTDSRLAFITQQIMPKTIQFWQDTLSVVPVQGNLFIQASSLANREFCGDSEFAQVPASHMSDGVSDVDIMLYVSAYPSTRFCPAGGKTLAVAVACNFDDFDRPTAGAINFCLDKIDVTRLDDPATLSDNIDVAVHEAAHVLGMSTNSYKYFYDPSTGKPRTARPFSASTVTCVDNTERTLVLPDPNTLKFFIANNGQRYAAIVTEKVKTVARNQFNCQTLEGAQLENQPTRDSCTGDHWDESKFYPESMSGVISPNTNIVSPLTFALFEDSGWYTANYDMSTMSPWGHGVGCDFVYENCLSGGEVPSYSRGFFCNTPQTKGCSSEHHYKMACTVLDYDLYYPIEHPPPQFQYFENAALGGPEQADYCPVYGSTYDGKRADQLDCRDVNNNPFTNWYSEVYGEDSRCFDTSTGEGRCYTAQCIYDEQVVKVNLRGDWFTCEEDFQELELRTATGLLGGTVICPRLAQICPDLFCPANCAGSGVCDYENVAESGVKRPKCQCFDSSDTTPGCTDTLTNDGKYLKDSSSLKNKVQNNFLDPLVSVFIDDPETWTNETWAWAAGLFVLFLMLLLCICTSLCPGSSGGNQKQRQMRRY